MPELETCIKFGEHSARVMIENKEVPHFDMHVDPEKREVSCWLASEEGKEFSVEWLELDVDYTSACYLYLDGQYVGCICRPSHSAELIKFWNCWVSESSKAPFLFSKLDVTDDDAYLDTPPSHSIGEIKLVIKRTTVAKVAPLGQCVIPSAPPQKVHERSKKAIAHQINYGSETPNLKTTKYLTKALETLVTFIFKYRPLEMLRANDIVPQNAEPLEPQENTLDTPSISETSSGKGDCSKLKKEPEAESGSESDDGDSIRETALLAELEKIRKRKHLKDNRPRKKVKKEEKPHFTPGEVIDLT